MAEKSTKSTAKKSSTKPKSTGKRLSVTIDPDTMAQLNEYLAQFGYSKDEFVKKAILEKISRDKISAMSKGTREKVQLVLVMSRAAGLYLLDEPIGGVDPAARDYILDTIIRNYSEDAALVLSTHLIGDIEKVLDDVVMIGGGRLVASGSVDELRAAQGKSVDAFFREVFKC